MNVKSEGSILGINLAVEVLPYSFHSFTLITLPFKLTESIRLQIKATASHSRSVKMEKSSLASSEEWVLMSLKTKEIFILVILR